MSMLQSGRGPTPEPTNLADILERVLDRGIVIAGDIRINLLDIELLTIKLRLVVASVDTAREMGIDWWERDPFLSSRPRPAAEAEDPPPAVAAEPRAGRRRGSRPAVTAGRAEDEPGYDEPEYDEDWHEEPRAAPPPQRRPRPRRPAREAR
ncbi:gas vesicle protein [Plantactinospora siamensis]|uniref:gas vesicle protein n=1 Tax=Plantactinospora siamensis TaxID=555372 RepID=UPI00406BB391